MAKSKQSRRITLAVPWKSRTLRRRLKKFKFNLELEIRQALGKIGFKFIRDLKLKRLSGPETTDKTLRARSGQLRDSFDFRLAGRTLADMEMRAYTTMPYARIHEFGTRGAGGTLDPITPKKAQWLTIPLKAALFPTGIARGSAREVGAQYDDVVFIRKAGVGAGASSEHESLIMYGREGDDLVPLFRLVKKVEIPPRLGFFDTWRKQSKWRSRVLGKAINKAKKRSR